MKHLKATKQFFLFVAIVAYGYSANAQASSDFSTSSLTSEQHKAITDTLPQKNVASQQPVIENSYGGNDNDTIIENRLVLLALMQPNYEQTLHQQKIYEYQLKKQRESWLNLLTFSTTYNDQSFAKPTTANGSTAYVYPKYYFGVTIPIGLIVSNGTDIKITKESEMIAKGQQEELAKSIKASVLTNYKEYKANEKLLAIQNQAVDDEQANFIQVEQKFKNGTATLDTYNEASKKYNDERVKIINLQLQQDLIKVELERLIGRKLEDVLKQ
jgi:outer membrane protein TolC